MSSTTLEGLSTPCIDATDVRAFTLAVDCGECPLRPKDDPEAIRQTGCAVLKLAQANDKLTEEVDYLSTDNLTQLLTPDGFISKIGKDPRIAEALRQGEKPNGKGWGMLYLDLRGLKFANKLGREVGDAFLKEGAHTITTEVTSNMRKGNPKDIVESSRRSTANSDPIEDIAIRVGGDELGVMVFDVSREELQLLQERFSSQLGVESAYGRYDSKKPPFIASVGVAYGPDMQTESFLKAQRQGDYESIFSELVCAADAQQAATAKEQYETMWNACKDADSNLAAFPRPADDRTIVELFYRNVFPQFANAPLDYLGQS